MITKLKGLISSASDILILSIIGQAIGIAAYPFLAKLYDPEAFGVYGVTLSIITVLTTISMARVELSIPSINKRIVNSVFILCFLFGLFSSFIFIIPLLLYSFWDLSLELRYVLYVVLGVFFMGVYRLGNMMSVQRSNYRLIGRARFIQLLLMIVIQLSFFNFSGDGLVLGFVLSYIFTSLVYLHNLKLPIKIRMLKAKYFDYYYKRNKKYFLFDTPGSFFNILSNELYSLLLPLYFGLTSGGLYIFTYRIMTIPVTLVGLGFGQALMGHSKDWLLNKCLFKNLVAFLLILIIILLPFSIVLFYFSDYLFVLVFGTKWALSGDIASILIISVFFQILFSPLTLLIPLLELQKFIFLFHFLMICMRVGLFYYLIADTDILNLLTAYSFISAFFYFIGVIFILFTVRKYENIQ